MAYTYDFTATNGTYLENIDPTPWVNIHNAYGAEVQSNQLAPVGYGGFSAYYYDATFASAHYTKIKFTAEASSSGDYVGVIVRGAAGGDYYYSIRGGASAKVYNGESVDGTPTDWDSGLSGCSINDVFGLYIDASTTTTVYYKVNDATVETYTSKDALSGGRAGVCTNSSGASRTARADDWEGGDVSSTLIIDKSDSITVTDTPTMGGVPNISTTDTINVTDTPTVQLEGEPPAALSIAITPDSVWAVGVRIYP